MAGLGVVLVTEVAAPVADFRRSDGSGHRTGR
jgi:hypothetical protein